MQCFVDFDTFADFLKKVFKIIEKSSKNLPKIEQKSRTNRKKSEQIDEKS